MPLTPTPSGMPVPAPEVAFVRIFYDVADMAVEVLAIVAKLPSGYHRDLQRIKAPLFRGIDLARDTMEVMAAALPEIRFHPERITLASELFTAEEAYRLVLEEGLPFREAYRRVAAPPRETETPRKTP